MNQLEIVHKKPKSTSKVNQKAEQVGEEINMREVRGATLATSRNVFYLLDSKDIYYVQSERSNNIYYFCKYNFDVFEYCSCLDNSVRGVKCKHQFAIEYAIRKGTLKEIEQLPKEAQRYPQVISARDYSREQREEDQYAF